jgi:hypothetical protein
LNFENGQEDGCFGNSWTPVSYIEDLWNVIVKHQSRLNIKKEVLPVAIGQDRWVRITVDVDTGEFLIEKAAGVDQTGDPTLEDPLSDQARGVEEAVGKDIAEIKRGKKRFLRIGEIIHTNPNGCVYWDGKRWVKYC